MAILSLSCSQEGDFFCPELFERYIWAPNIGHHFISPYATGLSERS